MTKVKKNKEDSKELEKKIDVSKEEKVENVKEEKVEDIVKEKKLKSGELCLEAQIVLTIFIGLLVFYAASYTLLVVYIK